MGPYFDVRLSNLTNTEINSTNVTLAGMVRNKQDRQAAGDVVRSVDSVVRVNNKLQIKNR